MCSGQDDSRQQRTPRVLRKPHQHGAALGSASNQSWPPPRRSAREPRANRGVTIRNATHIIISALLVSTALTIPAATAQAAPIATTPATAAHTATTLEARATHAAARMAARKPVARKAQGKLSMAQRRQLSAQQRRAAIVKFAHAQKGKRYRHGATGPRAFDCSGLTRAAAAAAGIQLPHSAAGQAGRGKAVSRKNARPGDLVIMFGNGHAGIYIGNGKMIDSARPGLPINVRPTNYGGAHFRNIIGD